MESSSNGGRSQAFFHGTRADRKPGDLIEPGTAYVYLTRVLDAAIWAAELAAGEGTARVYVVEPTGPVEDAPELTGPKSPAHPSMSCRSREPLRVVSEVTEWLLYHGTRADLKPGDMITPGQTSNFGKTARRANHVYFSRTLDAAAWGAELAAGEGRGRIYVVEPSGPTEDDPNLTNKMFRGNPTKSFRSREPLRIAREITEWKGHSPEAIQAMKDGLRRLQESDEEAIDD